MPYEVLEQQIKALPKVYFYELIDYLEYLTKKAQQQKTSEEESLQSFRESELTTVDDEIMTEQNNNVSDFDNAFGLWKNRDINLQDIRKKAWERI